MAKFDKVIPPGQEGTINMVIEGKKVSGNFSKSATIHSNDPEKPVMNVSLVGNKVPFVNVAPSDRLYLQGRYGEKIEKEITVTSNEEELAFQITGVESNIDDKITYKVEPGPEAGSYTVKVWKNPKLPTLNTYGSLTLRTNSEKSPEKIIQVQIVTKGSITVQPTTINYGAIKFSKRDEEAQVVTRSVSVIKSQGAFEIREILFNSDLYEASVEEVVPGKRYKVDVKFRPPLKRQSRQREVGEMIIHTSDPQEPTLRVKLVARAM